MHADLLCLLFAYNKIRFLLDPYLTGNLSFVYREDLEKHYLYYRRPYNGELGIESYEQWQLPHYALVSMFNPLVKINNYFDRKNVNTFLPISFNISCECSKEPSH